MPLMGDGRGRDRRGRRGGRGDRGGGGKLYFYNVVINFSQ